MHPNTPNHPADHTDPAPVDPDAVGPTRGEDAAQVRNSFAFFPALIRSHRNPTWMPQGVNDFTTPLPEGCVPVVLIHGTWLNAYSSFSYLAPRLAEEGYRVFAFNYGRDTSALTGRHKAIYGLKPLLESQLEVAAFIRSVLERTGAKQVDLIGHSQGVAQARLFLTDSGGADAEHPERNIVRKVIGIGGSNHGTTLGGGSSLVQNLARRFGREEKSDANLRKILGQAALDQRAGSPAVAHLNRMGDTMPGIEYLMICSRFDQVVTPWRSQRLTAGPGARVTNVLLQTGNIKDFSDHLAILYSPRVLDLILEELSCDATYRDTHPIPRGTVIAGFGQVNRPRLSQLRRVQRRRK